MLVLIYSAISTKMNFILYNKVQNKISTILKNILYRTISYPARFPLFNYKVHYFLLFCAFFVTGNISTTFFIPCLLWRTYQRPFFIHCSLLGKHYNNISILIEVSNLPSKNLTTDFRVKLQESYHTIENHISFFS
jgi:hypothetical protein